MNINHDMLRSIAGKMPIPKSGMGIKQCTRWHDSLSSTNSMSGTRTMGTEHAAHFFARNFSRVIVDNDQVLDDASNIVASKEIIVKARIMNPELDFYANIDCYGNTGADINTSFVEKLSVSRVSGVHLESFHELSRADQNAVLDKVHAKGMKAIISTYEFGTLAEEQSFYVAQGGVMMNLRRGDIIGIHNMFSQGGEGLAPPERADMFWRWHTVNNKDHWADLGGKTPQDYWNIEFMAMDTIDPHDAEYYTYVNNSFIGCVFFGIDNFLYNQDYMMQGDFVNTGVPLQPHIENLVLNRNYLERYVFGWDQGSPTDFSDIRYQAGFVDKWTGAAISQNRMLYQFDFDTNYGYEVENVNLAGMGAEQYVESTVGAGVGGGGGDAELDKLWINGFLPGQEGSGASFQVNGFMRVGNVMIHEGGNTPNGSAGTLGNASGSKLQWNGSNIWMDSNTGDLVVNSNGKTIAASNLANGWLRIGTGLAMDDNEIFFSGTGYLGSLVGGSLVFKIGAAEMIRMDGTTIAVKENLLAEKKVLIEDWAIEKDSATGALTFSI